jgi:hypothetical protein
MKTFALTIMLSALSAGVAMAGSGYGYGNGSCVGNYSRACRDARNAFASHHGGLFPEQYRGNRPYYNHGAYERGYWNGERAEEREEHHEHHRHEHHHDRDDW